MEKASARKLRLVRLAANSKVKLSDGSTLEVRGQDVGRVNQFGNFWAFTPGTEIVFDEKIFMPPISTRQRRVPDALGPYKLDTGEGYLIHGTHLYNSESIGQAVSHGCVRMDNTDLERLYHMVTTGTPVYIF
jgi:lipoprotein-anchoring transpeptidase ErfK/SrfK